MILYSVIGGMLGVFVFTFFSDKIHLIWTIIKSKLKKTFNANQNYSEPVADIEKPIKIKYEYVNANQPTRKVFTKRNRRLVILFKKYGLFGIALLTPILISIPIGTVVANSFEANKRKIFLYMFISILFWSTVMVSLFEIFHAKNVIDLQEHIIQ